MTETESRPRNRALVASFLFTDLVGYSKGTASDQYAAKATLSEILGKNLAALDKDDYRIKDTGDGALIAFLSNPEHALYMALAIAHDFARAAGAAGFPSNSVRTGLHIGAVKEAIDLEARPNFVGDGINAAKRIMDFAEPGQITASRAYFEAVSWLDSAYAALFQHLGASDDKHGRPHELYAIAPSDTVLERLRLELGSATREAGERERNAAPPPTERRGDATAIPSGSPAAPGRASTGQRKWFAPIAASIALASIVLLVWTQDPFGVTTRLSTSKAQSALPAGTAAVSPTTTNPERAADVPASAATPKPDPALSPPVAPKADAATAARGSQDATNATPTIAPRTTSSVRSNTTNAAVDTPRRATEVPAAPVAASAPSAPNSARCRHILEKVQLGEPLSQDEKRELASSCR